MSAFLHILQITGLIIAVILIFNVIIFVHELGHFWAARWRGLYVDRFQVWFGKPIWSKKINGVQWGLGWLPLGGFVSLPQLAPMEAIEGDANLPENLPVVRPLDKIIVAFAGPFFSFLLALVAAFGVWKIGVPKEKFPVTTIGFVMPDGPADQAGVMPGDKVLAVDGELVTAWSGDFRGVGDLIRLSDQEKVHLTIQRPGETVPREIFSSYKLPETKWYQRKSFRQIGIVPAEKAVVKKTLEHSPAQKAGLKKGDIIKAVNGQPIFSPAAVSSLAEKGTTLDLQVERANEAGVFVARSVSVAPKTPNNIADAKPMIGIFWGDGGSVQQGVSYPSPAKSIGDSAKMIKVSVDKILAPKSDVGVQHLSGPFGIATMFYDILSLDSGWKIALWLCVLINVNLAILNLMPFPVLDGGHIVLGFLEMLRGKPVSAKPLAIVQNAFVYLLFGFFLFVTFKDIGDRFGRKPPPVPTFDA